jgi:tRNA (adenine22-N1)-methyltransferase
MAAIAKETDNMNLNSCTIESRMSARLIAIAQMLGQPVEGEQSGNGTVGDAKGALRCKVVADVGCDHGYVSIYLVQSGIADRAIAMDVRKGPLSGADDNIREYGLSEKIETRLSDGLKALLPGEADALVIAGMGGKLMIRILQEGNPKALGLKEAILQPQSDIDEFRRFLRSEGYVIADEKIILDEGKYYFPMHVCFAGDAIEPGVDGSKPAGNHLQEAVALLTDETGCSTEVAQRICDKFGEHNILRRDELLKDFCKHGREVTTSILKGLEKSGHNERFRELSGDLEELEAVLRLYN